MATKFDKLKIRLCLGFNSSELDGKLGSKLVLMQSINTIQSPEKTKENSNLLKLQDRLSVTLQEMKEDEISNNGLLRFIRATEERHENND